MNMIVQLMIVNSDSMLACSYLSTRYFLNLYENSSMDDYVGTWSPKQLLYCLLEEERYQ